MLYFIQITCNSLPPVGIMFGSTRSLKTFVSFQTLDLLNEALMSILFVAILSFACTILSTIKLNEILVENKNKTSLHANIIFNQRS